MPECNYCGETFDDEDAYLSHLASTHEGELSRLDRRRVSDHQHDDGGGLPTGPLVLGLVLAISIGVVIYVILFVGGGANSGPVNGIDVAQHPGQVTPDAHEHGPIDMVVMGEEVDFSRPEYQRHGEYGAFHFEGGDGRVWHKHAPGVTLEYAMATLGIEVTETSVTIDGTTYRDSDPNTEVIVEVNGEPVDPRSYELQGVEPANGQGGDDVQIVVRDPSAQGGQNETATQ